MHTSYSAEKDHGLPYPTHNGLRSVMQPDPFSLFYGNNAPLGHLSLPLSPLPVPDAISISDSRKNNHRISLSSRQSRRRNDSTLNADDELPDEESDERANARPSTSYISDYIQIQPFVDRTSGQLSCTISQFNLEFRRTEPDR